MEGVYRNDFKTFSSETHFKSVVLHIKTHDLYFLLHFIYYCSLDRSWHHNASIVRDFKRDKARII